MVEPQKPFACGLPDCGMTFTNEDHLNVHTKKHDLSLHLGTEHKAAFVADQTPTPTRFIRNCEEVGLFQDLQNVNPFDEGFKRAMETKHGILSLENTATGADDVLHTPQMVFPLIDSADSTLLSTTNNQRNITISRSSSDESGTMKGYETTTIAKLTNEVTTISRLVNNNAVDKTTIDANKNNTKNDTNTNGKVSFKNSLVKIARLEDVVFRNDGANDKIPLIMYKDARIVTRDVLLTDNNKLQLPDKVPPIMSQKSLDYVVDSLTSPGNVIYKKCIDLNTLQTEINKTETKVPILKPFDHINKDLRKKVEVIPRVTRKVKPMKRKIVKTPPHKIDNNDIEVIIRLPNGKQVTMQAVKESNTKEILRKTINNKELEKSQISLSVPKTPVKSMQKNVLQTPTGTLIPVTLVNRSGAPISSNDLNKLPITKVGTQFLTMNSAIVPISKGDLESNKARGLNTPIEVKSDSGLVQNEPNEVVQTDGMTDMVHSVQFSGVKISEPFQIDVATGKRKEGDTVSSNHNTEADNVICITHEDITDRIKEQSLLSGQEGESQDEDCAMEEEAGGQNKAKRTKFELESRCASSKRYRERLKGVMGQQAMENRQLREANQRLIAEKAVLKLFITEHMKRCPNADDLRITQERLLHAMNNL